MSRLVLIVEDSETCAETLEIALELIPGVEVRSIHSSVAAIDFLNGRDAEVAAIVTDLNLPAGGAAAGDGLDLISGDSDPQLGERALAEGANAFFPKPYSPAAVRRRLEQLLC